MCGRFVRYSLIHDILKEFDVEGPAFDLSPSYNVAPSHEIVTIINEGKKRIVLCKWGYIPSWAKDPATGYKIINARAESVGDKASFKYAFMHKRILVVANGFYEWHKQGKAKIPVYIQLKTGIPFGFAGLLSLWTSPGGKQVRTCTVITTNANRLLAPIHDRMPVIIHKKDENLWLDPANQDKHMLTSLLKPYAEKDMIYYPVSALVNSPSYNSPDCIRPVDSQG